MNRTANQPLKTGKAEQTRAVIIKTALELFLERGYEETTMRAIAERAGLSLGNAYYYFPSKEHLIQAFYDHTHHEHVAACAGILDKERDLKPRLLEVMRAKIATIEPYHKFAGKLFKTAADPGSPLNPFSDESDPVRQESTDLFKQVLEESKARVPADLKRELPYMLWLYHMGIILFWIHDRSPHRKRTQRLLERSVDLIVKMISLASNPLMAPLRKASLRLIVELRQDLS